MSNDDSNKTENKMSGYLWVITTGHILEHSVLLQRTTRGISQKKGGELGC